METIFVVNFRIIYLFFNVCNGTRLLFIFLKNLEIKQAENTVYVFIVILR